MADVLVSGGHFQRYLIEAAVFPALDDEFKVALHKEVIVLE